MAGCGQPEPVPETSRGVQLEAGWLQPGKRGPQRQGVFRRGLRDETNLAIAPLRSSCEAAERGLVIGHGHQPFDTVH
jgi:hypothetical protein